MQRRTLAPILLLMACLVLSAATVQDEVIQAESAWTSAVTKGDYAALDKLVADDLIYTHSAGLVENKKVYFDRLRAGTLKYESIEREGTVVNAYGTSAVLHCKVRMKGVSDGQAFNVSAVITHVWVKQGGAWKLAAHQATRLP